MNAFYQSNISKTKQELSVLDKQINSNSLLRLAVILVGSAVLFKLFQLNNIWYLLIAVFAIIISFAFLVRRQSKLEAQREEKRAYLRVNENEIAISNDEANIYANGEQFEDPKHAYISDLDIFGNKSLFALINRAATLDGVQTLANWFLKPSLKQDILARQVASAELSQKNDWTQLLQTKLLFNLGQQINLKTYLERYLQDNALSFGSSFMRFYVKICPFIFLLGILISVFYYPIWNGLFYLGIAHLIWSMALGGKVSYFSNRIDKVGSTLMAYADAVKMIEEEQFNAPLLLALQDEMKTSNKQKMSVAFKGLGVLVDKLDARNNILVGAFLNMLFLWDFRQVLAIVDWKKNYEHNILQAFQIVAEVEALVSLSTLKANYTTWTTPQILDDTSTFSLTAEDVNHPLITKSIAVGNNYSTIDHNVALITGSNMAGKSTFLRTVGINAVLAYTGAVVCANKFEIPIYHLVSYMRIKDNLNESTSTFKAELDRMRFILQKVNDQPDTLFLIDEMLRGTNSVDKYLGSKAIIKKLIGMNGKGMVATHDLQLSNLEEEYPGVLKNYHFDIQVQQGEMLFDYKLKNGKCTIFNASMLLKDIGIDVNQG